ncbi:MAG: hypothetical protein ACM359_17180 [Bacillota bacterium]
MTHRTTPVPPLILPSGLRPFLPSCLRAFVPVLVLLTLAGCEIPAQTYWSPDGTHAAYVPPSGSESPAMIIDDQGAIVAKLGATTGGFAWSNDSKRLYFAVVDPKSDTIPPFETRHNWLNVSEEQFSSKKNEDDKDKQETTVSLWENGKTTPLFVLEAQMPWMMALSPDQNWLALVTNTSEKDSVSRLYAFSLPTKRLYAISLQCAKTACFTGPNRLAFVEANSVNDAKPSDTGMLTEVVLNDGAEHLDRQPLAIVLLPLTPWIQPLGQDILLTSFSFTFPGPIPQTDPEENAVFTLFRYVHADKTVKPLATEVGQYFLTSPDGKRILVEKILNPADKDKRQSKIAVIESATGSTHILADATVTLTDPAGNRHTGFPAYPAWRSNDELSFTSPIDPIKPIEQKDSRYYFNLALYRLTPDYQLKPLRTLSDPWPLEIKPSFKSN